MGFMPGCMWPRLRLDGQGHKKAATECEICGGFFVYGHILLGSAVTISGKNHKIASASTIKPK